MNSQDQLILWCACCDNDPILKVKPVKIYYESAGFEDYYQVVVELINSKGVKTKEQIDLAYVHIKKDNKAYCVGTELGFECDPCTAPFVWEGAESIKVLKPISGARYQGIEKTDLSDEHISSIISRWLVGECAAAVPFGDNADVTAIQDVENAVTVDTDHVSTGREHHIIATRDLHFFAIHS